MDYVEVYNRTACPFQWTATAESGIPIVLTEGRYGGIPGLNRGRIFTTRVMGIAYARIMNMYERNGDVLKSAIICDYTGMRWLCHGVLIPAFYGKVFGIAQPSEFEIYNRETSDMCDSVMKPLPGNGKWSFPGASVTAVELRVE